MPEIKITRLLPPTDWVDKQLGTLSAVGRTNYEKRIAIPKKSPIAAGIAAEDRYADEMRKVLEERRRAKGLQASSDDEWYKYSKEIGAARLVEGVTKRKPEVDKFVSSWQPVLADHLAKIDPMSTTTFEDRIQKAVANMRGLKELKGAWRKAV